MKTLSLINTLKKKWMPIKIISDDFKLKGVYSRNKDPMGFPQSFGPEKRQFYNIELGFKRCMDVIIALIGLILVAPVLFLIVFRLIFEDDGILFIQKRIGKNGKPFLMYKLRTMIKGAEDQKEHLNSIATDGFLFKVKNDPRVTRFGRFLRKYNLDELPQLINVLKGEMSVIGPRPPLPEEVALYDEWHKVRLKLKPGITGLWQVNKERKWEFDEVIKLDIFYILNWSLFLDVKILFKTPAAILRGNGE